MNLSQSFVLNIFVCGLYYGLAYTNIISRTYLKRSASGYFTNPQDVLLSLKYRQKLSCALACNGLPLCVAFSLKYINESGLFACQLASSINWLAQSNNGSEIYVNKTGGK
jgi:hypothetical protein